MASDHDKMFTYLMIIIDYLVFAQKKNDSPNRRRSLLHCLNQLFVIKFSIVFFKNIRPSSGKLNVCDVDFKLKWCIFFFSVPKLMKC